MSLLLVSLPSEPATPATEWAYAASPDGRTLGDHGRTPAALLPLLRGAGAEIVAVVPVHALAWHRVELPKGIAPGTPRLRAALEGLLEEELLDDTEALHFALQPGARGGEAAWVAVCDRAWLRQALQALEAAGRGATRIVPEFAPEGAPALAVIGDAEQPFVVASSPDGVLALPLSAAVLPLPACEAPLPAAPALELFGSSPTSVEQAKLEIASTAGAASTHQRDEARDARTNETAIPLGFLIRCFPVRNRPTRPQRVGHPAPSTHSVGAT